MEQIWETARSIPVAEQADICVLGGSCTGVFAAVRAARLGARVVLIEKQNSFGGTATSSMVNTWTSLHDTERKHQIIGGLTVELINRMKKRDAIILNPKKPAEFIFNSEELKIELDELVTESAVKPYLHTLYTMPHVEDGNVKAVFLENKSGRFAVKAKYFIDATGDADLCAQLGATYKRVESLQPPTPCAKFHGIETVGLSRFKDLISMYGEEFGLRKDGGWGGSSACVPGLTFHAETHVYETDCSDGDMLTAAEIEGRRQIRAIMDIVRKYGSDGSSISLAALCTYIGIRETRHIKSRYQLTVGNLLSGMRFEDAIANGTRQVDIHHHDKPGMTFKFLDGRETYSSNDVKWEGRWRPETNDNPTFWQIPFRSLLPEGLANVIACGRSIDADSEAFGAVRLMVSTNQMGEAAGVAAVLAHKNGKGFDQIKPLELKSVLEQGGSIIM